MQRRPGTLETTAYAKLNLALHVRARGHDGYHALETIFAFTDFGDVLRAEAAAGLQLRITGPFGEVIAGEADNLVLRAARALAAAAGVATDAVLVLDKHIPVAAGLGGGSADAAAALRLLNELWGLGWPAARLAALGATLGADVAACVASVTVRGEGRGERLHAVDGAALAGRRVLLVNPRVAVATGPVFAGWDGVDRGGLGAGLGGAGLDDAGLNDSGLAAARNDLEPPALRLAPVIGAVLAALRRLPGAGLVRMSGSGATCFALFGPDSPTDSPTDPNPDSTCDSAAAALAQAHPDWWICPTRLR